MKCITGWIALSAAIFASTLLAACDNRPAENTDAAPDGVHLVNPGKLTVCTNLPFEPFQFNQDGKVVGFDVDIVDLAAAKLGVTQEIVNIDFAVIKSGAALNSGKCDLAAAGMTITDERKQNLDFSVPYFEASQALMGKKGRGLTSLEDVKAKGLKLGALASTTGLDYAKSKGFDPVQFADSQKVLLSLDTGQTDVIIMDVPVVLTWLKKPELGARFELIAQLDTGEQFGIGMKKGNDALGKVVSGAIETARKDGGYAAIYRKWFWRRPATVTAREAVNGVRSERPRSFLNPLQKRRLARAVQYTLLAGVLGFIVLRADWGAVARSFFNAGIAKQGWPELFTVALRNTVLYTVAGYAFGFAAGLTLALMRLSSVPPYRWIATAYVEIFRGLPALVIFLMIGSLPLGFPGFAVPGGVYGMACLGLGLVSAAYMAETFRAGLQAVPKGQMEAARSLGMTRGQAMVSIVIPQALRIVIPPLTNELVLLFKDSSLVLFFGVTSQEVELAKFGNDQASTFANPTPIFVAGMTYLLITIPLGYVARRLEARREKN